MAPPSAQTSPRHILRRETSLMETTFRGFFGSRKSREEPQQRQGALRPTPAGEVLRSLIQSSIGMPTAQRQETNQPSASPVSYNTWDKTFMEEHLDALNVKNKMLENLVARVKGKDPLVKIQNGLKEPTLWNDNQSNREELTKLHIAISASHTSRIRLAIQLDLRYDETLKVNSRHEFDGSLHTREPPVYFRLKKPDESKIILARSTTSRQHADMQNLLSETLDYENRFPGNTWFSDIGDVQYRQDEIFNLRLINHQLYFRYTLGDMITDLISFDLESRVQVAAEIAVAYLQFAGINRGDMPREVANYRISQSPKQRRTAPPRNRVWLDNGFGARVPVSTNSGNGDMFEDDPASVETEAARELGRLLYQIFNCDILNEATSAEQDKRVLDSLNQFGSVCMPIIQACFSEKSPPAGRPYAIIEYVAHALLNYVADSAVELQAEEDRLRDKLIGAVYRPYHDALSRLAEVRRQRAALQLEARRDAQGKRAQVSVAVQQMEAPGAEPPEPVASAPAEQARDQAVVSPEPEPVVETSDVAVELPGQAPPAPVEHEDLAAAAQAVDIALLASNGSKVDVAADQLPSGSCIQGNGTVHTREGTSKQAPVIVMPPEPPTTDPVAPSPIETEGLGVLNGSASETHPVQIDSDYESGEEADERIAIPAM